VAASFFEETSVIHYAYHNKLPPVRCSTEEYEKLLATGTWFDCPSKAQKEMTEKPEVAPEKKADVPKKKAFKKSRG